MSDKIMTFEDSVKERLKSIVAELIPEHRWNDIVSATITDFEKIDLPKMIKEQLAEKYKAAISTELSKPEYYGQWENCQQQASENIKKLIVESAPLVLAGLFGNSIQAVLERLRQEIQYARI